MRLVGFAFLAACSLEHHHHRVPDAGGSAGADSALPDARIDAGIDATPPTPPGMTQQAYLKAAAPDTYMRFGSAVAVSTDGSLVVVMDGSAL